MPEHKNITAEERHSPFRQVFADDAERTADATVYAAEELYAMAYQVDTGALYVLTAISPITWTVVP